MYLPMDIVQYYDTKVTVSDGIKEKGIWLWVIFHLSARPTCFYDGWNICYETDLI